MPTRDGVIDKQVTWLTELMENPNVINHIRLDLLNNQ